MSSPSTPKQPPRPSMPPPPPRKPKNSVAPPSRPPRTAPTVSLNSATRSVARSTGALTRLGNESVLSQGMPVHNSGLWHGSASSTNIANGIRLRGCERLASITGATGRTAGATMASVNLNPKLIGVRLPLMAEQYEKFLFKKATLHYVASISPANASANGMLYMVAAFDPREPIPDDLDSLASWAQNKAVTAVYQNCDLRIDLQLNMQDPLFVDTQGDVRFGIQAVLAVIAGNAQTANIAYGQWFIDYEIELTNSNTSVGESSNMVGVRFLNVRGGDIGPTIVSRAVSYVGDTDILSLPPQGSTASYIIAPGYWVMSSFTRSNLPMTSTTGVPLVVVTGGTNVGIGANWQVLGSPPGYTAAGSLVPLFANAPPFNENNTPINDTTDTVGCANQSFWSTGGGITSAITLQMQLSAGLPANTQFITDIIFTRYPASTYNVDSLTLLSSSNRQTPSGSVLTIKQFAALCNYNIDAELAPFYAACRAFVRAPGPGQFGFAAMFNDCFNLGEHIPDAPLNTAPVAFLHPAVEVGLFLMQKFGATIAAHLLGMAKEKLEKWIKDNQ